MNGFNRFFVATFVSSAMLLPSVTRAMEIRQFDKMAGQDRSDYIAVMLMGAQKILIEQGKPELAIKVHKLFTEVLPGNTVPTGLIQFENNLAALRVNDAQEAVKDPKAPRLEAEDAMLITLHKNGIELPDSFYTVASGFHPKLPPQQSKDAAKKNTKKNN